MVKLKCNICEGNMIYKKVNNTHIYCCNDCANIQLEYYNKENIIDLYNYLENNEKTEQEEDIDYLLKMIYQCNFDVLINKNGTLSLENLQGGNLGGIEFEEFETITDVCERLEDYFFEEE